MNGLLVGSNKVNVPKVSSKFKHHYLHKRFLTDPSPRIVRGVRRRPPYDMMRRPRQIKVLFSPRPAWTAVIGPFIDFSLKTLDYRLNPDRPVPNSSMIRDDL